MGFLTLFSKPAPDVLRLPTGSFSVDRDGGVLISTLPSNFPTELVQEIGAAVQTSFREAADADLPLSEIVIHYPSLRITAREMRGGALVFLTPLADAGMVNPLKNPVV